MARQAAWDKFEQKLVEQEITTEAVANFAAEDIKELINSFGFTGTLFKYQK